MEIVVNMEPYELAENIVDDREACCICTEILRQWNHLPQKMYEEVLEEIPEYAIKQYLRKKSREKKAHLDSIKGTLKKRQLDNERE